MAAWVPQTAMPGRLPWPFQGDRPVQLVNVFVHLQIPELLYADGSHSRFYHPGLQTVDLNLSKLLSPSSLEYGQPVIPSPACTGQRQLLAHQIALQQTSPEHGCGHGIAKMGIWFISNGPLVIKRNEVSPNNKWFSNLFHRGFHWEAELWL